jgi:hypothetical protein
MGAATGPKPRAGAGAGTPVPDRRAAAAGSVAASNTTTRAEARRLERFRGGANGARATDAAKGASPASARLTFPLRSLAVAAGLACVALLGYMAGQIGRQGRAERTGESTQANTLTPTPAQAQTRGGARGGDARVRGRAAEASPSQPAAPVATRPAPAQPRSRGITPVPAATATAAPTPAPPPAPTVGVVRGVVRDAGGSGVAGARVSVRGTALSAVADGSGAFEIRDVPDGQVALQASADGFVAGSAQVRATAGAIIAADLTLERVPAPPPPAAAPAASAASAAEPDRELAAGGWIAVDRAAATSLLGGTLGAIQGLSIESISSSAAGSRPRVRLAQLTATGERIVLTETRAGAAVRGGAGPAVVTALRVMPASEAYPWCTGTASLGNILVTVKTKLSADALRPLLQRLGEVPGQ